MDMPGLGLGVRWFLEHQVGAYSNDDKVQNRVKAASHIVGNHSSRIELCPDEDPDTENGNCEVAVERTPHEYISIMVIE